MPYNLEGNDLNAQLNGAVRDFMEGMRKEGILSAEDITKMNGYAVVLLEHGRLGGFWNKLWGKSKNSIVQVVKIIE
jgi:hypothetical protein